MLLQLQFIANGIIGLLSQSITSLLKLISMIIHWNHQENTLSWWVLPPHAVEKNELTLTRKPVVSVPSRPFSPPVQVNNALWFLQQFWKTRCPFLETATRLHFYPQFPRTGNANWSGNAEDVGLSRVWIWGRFQFICSLYKYWLCLLYLTSGKQLSPSVPLFPCQ